MSIVSLSMQGAHIEQGAGICVQSWMTTHVFKQTVGMKLLQIRCGFAMWCWGRRCIDKKCEGDLIAPARTKVHRMQHLPRLAGIINPRCVQCYGEESLTGTTTQVWRKCVNGRYDKSATQCVVEAYHWPFT